MSAIISDTCGFTEVTVFYEEAVVTPTIIAENIADVPAAGVTDATATIKLKGLDGVTVNAAADGTVVTAASVSGNTLTYTVSANETFETREGLITLSAEGATDVTIKVAQLAKEAVTLTLTPDTDITLEATDENSYDNITVTTDATETKVGVFEEEAGTTEVSWLVASIADGKLSYMAEANTGAERVAYIVVTATKDGVTKKATIKVTQKTALIGNPTNIKVDTATFNATTLNATWDAVEHAASYEWEIKNSTGTLVATCTISTNSLNLDLNNPGDVLFENGFTQFVAGTQYVLYVKSIAADGYTAPTDFAKSAEFSYSAGGETGTEKTTSLTFSSKYSSNQKMTTINEGDITITFDKGSNKNAPQYYTNGTAIRAYGGNTFTVSVSTGKTISKITITFGDKDGTNTITTDKGSFTSPTWEGSENSVIFTVGGSSGNRRLAGIEITYK